VGIIDLAHLHGWRVAHFRPARTAAGWRTPVAGDGVGCPDLIMVRGPRLIAAELKSKGGDLTVEQIAWLASVDGIEVHTWRPEHYPLGSPRCFGDALVSAGGSLGIRHTRHGRRRVRRNRVRAMPRPPAS